MPLDRIEDLVITTDHPGLVALSVHLMGGWQLRFLFEPSARDDLESLVGKFFDRKGTIPTKAASLTPSSG
jgi:hypothetical protein